MKLEDLELGKQYVTGDAYGYFLVEITKTAHSSPEYGEDFIQVQCKQVKTGKLAHFGARKPYSMFYPYFETYENWIRNCPPEMIDEMKGRLM